MLSLHWVMRALGLLAAPFVVMWAQAQALLATGRGPRASWLHHISRRLGRRQAHATMCSGPDRGKEVNDQRAKVIVIAGPTATGKSDIAMELCRRLGGEIVSADSVQVYRQLQVGANKPSAEERAAIPHHLLDLVGLDQTFTAGDFVRHAHQALDDILARGHVPVVVGGTMMYVQWLVHGPPDAPPSDPKVAGAIAREMKPYRDRGDWDGALQVLADLNSARAEKLHRNDWYRLKRSLEVSRTSPTPFTGERRDGGQGKYDFRAFFVVGDRVRLCRRIDERCESMLVRGLLRETAALLERGELIPGSMPGRSIGYRQAIDLLLDTSEAQPPPSSSADSGSDGMLAATDRAQGLGGHMRPEDDVKVGRGAGAVAVETGSGGQGAGTAREGGGVLDRERFLDFYYGFAAKTRRYAVDQMKWFRSGKGSSFLWEAWDLGEEGSAVGEGRHGGAGSGRGKADVAESVAEHVALPRFEFEERLRGAGQAELRRQNAERAGEMKRYATRLSVLEDPAALDALVADANTLRLTPRIVGACQALAGPGLGAGQV